MHAAHGTFIIASKQTVGACFVYSGICVELVFASHVIPRAPALLDSTACICVASASSALLAAACYKITSLTTALLQHNTCACTLMCTPAITD
jgi:ethanolamine utilization microcompartment shell protein EutL